LDIKNLEITDMVLVSEKLLLFSNASLNKLALVDINSSKVVSEIELKETPCCVCKIDCNLAAASGNTIQFLKIDGNALTCDRAIPSYVKVLGIALQGNNLVVTIDSPPGVQILSMEGKMIHKLDNTKAGKKVFKKPRWIATTSDDSIYVTDWGTHKITRLDSSLTILQTFSGAMLNHPNGILALNRDQLLVCNKHNNILLIRPSTSNMTVLLDKQHGIERPQSICFCKEQKKLYVARDRDTIVVYQLMICK